MIEIPERVKQKIIYVAEYVGDSTSDWITIKKEIKKRVRSEDRLLFTIRHRSTMKHPLNDFEREVMKFWKELTGVLPIMDPARYHDPNWTPQPLNERMRQALKEYQENRRKAKEEAAAIKKEE